MYGRAGVAARVANVVARALPCLAAAIASVLFVSSQAHARAGGPDGMETVVANDNTRAAGVVDRGTVMIRVRAARGRWAPEGPDGPVLTIDAFGEEGSALTLPAPLIRIVEGTIVAVSLRNDSGRTSPRLRPLHARRRRLRTAGRAVGRHP